ncbi:MAG: adaptive-response sensory kinase [Chloroflexi bacterium ADurb.Bin120]|jgi:signal transduction histidine kinase|uniref:Putative Histidine kinase n=1 Tax=Candidatus Brevifilum fermentans TaxID=1986204 RepID=A0A1Y6K5K6_9CHLR|nr:ATP-binding protein [Brevefilum fermentans]OQB82906.1 MAG: adaptive-response sensory kinase [Chloroflexi bacterium ADurb.Bin120]SMX54914.1 putative Histidine kinase [Brevefilum fermentans]
MAANLTSLFNFLTTPPGDLIYHLVTHVTLVFVILYLLFKRWEPDTRGQARRSLIGCIILILLQLSLCALRFISSSTHLHNIDFPPIFERLVASLTILWVIWTLFTGSQRKTATTVCITLSLTLIVLALVSVLIKPHFAVIFLINPLALDFIWQLIALLMIVIGIILAISLRPPMMKVLNISLLGLACGHLLQILLINEMDWQMGAVRLSQMLSLPWLIAIIKYLSSGITHVSSAANLSDTAVIKNGKKPVLANAEVTADTKPALVNLLLKINTTQTKDEKYQTVAQALSLSVVADICFLISRSKEDEKIHILCGYDLIRETILKADILSREDLPNVITAWESRQALNLSYADANLRDAQTLAMLLNYHTIGSLFAYPLGLPGHPWVGGVFFLSPYTGKRWDDKTLQLMDQIKDTLSMVLFGPDALEAASQESIQAEVKINALLQAAENLHAALTEKETLIREKDALIKGLKAKFQIDRMESVTRQEELQQKITDLTAQIASQPGISSKLEQLEEENRRLSSERDQLMLDLNRTKNMLTNLQMEAGQTGPIRLSLESSIISLDSIAANARLRVVSQLQGRNIDLEIHNPDGRLMIKTDPELLQTALYELLTNAILATEYGGTIRLEQKISLEMGMLTVQVTDFGVGLTQAEQTALFSAQHEVIPGIGSVPAVRNAIRAIRVLNGKIWLKSKKVSYTTFRFQIPVRIID